MPNLNPKTTRPAALTIAGSDSGGGAGVQADLKTFAALEVHGTSAITCITAQNPRQVCAIQPISPRIVQAQIEAVLEAFRPTAVKTGMLYSAGIIEAVLESLAGRKLTLIADPVMAATSGAKLLQDRTGKSLEKLFRAAALVTPNLSECEQILGCTIVEPEDLRSAAREIHTRFGCAVLVKGGHLRSATAVDFFFDGRTELLLEAPVTLRISTHGTGCTLSAAIAGYCALGLPLEDSVIRGKEFISNAIAASVRSAEFKVLNPFWARETRS